MCNLKNLFSVVALMIVVNMGYGQQNYTFDLPSQATPANGKYQVNNINAPATYGYFYLTGDGFFKTSNLSSRWYGPMVSSTPYTATSFELNPYTSDPPKKGTKPTTPYTSTFAFHTPVSMPNPTSVATSWSPSQTSYNYYILKAKKPSTDPGVIPCVEFHYNDAITDLDIAGGGPILDNYANTNWFTSRETDVSTFPGFTNKITWRFSNQMIVGDTGLVYIPMKSKLPATSTIKIGTKHCTESALRYDVFQVAGVPYDPNTIEAKEECFYPNGNVPPGLQQLPGHRINYKVRFQNKGTGPATNVRVEIPLDAKIDRNSISIIDSEYPCTFLITSNLAGTVYTLNIKFQNINLPGIKQTNPTVTYDESEGWVNFTLCTKKFSEIDWSCGPIDALPACCVYHQAKIYFDNQQPITTNTASTCLQCNNTNTQRYNVDFCTDARTKKVSTNGSVSIIPNPANDYVKLSVYRIIENAHVQIFDQTGRLVVNQRYASFDQHTIIDVNDLHTGNYTIKLTSDQELMVLRFIKQ